MKKLFLTFAAAVLVMAGCEKTPGTTDTGTDTTGPDPTYYEITVNVGDGGQAAEATIEDEVVTKAFAGEEIILTATPSGTHEFDKWIAEGVDIEDPTDNPLTFTMPEGDVSFTAEFRLLPPETIYSDVSVTAGEGGTASATPNSHVAEGREVTATATATAGYEFVKWTAGGITPTNPAQNPLNFLMPAVDVSLEAEFVKLEEHDIKISPTAVNGSVTIVKNSDNTPVTKAVKGTEVKITATAYAGYNFTRWNLTGATLTTSATVTPGRFIMPDGEVTVEAVFEPVKYAIDITQPMGGFIKATVGGTEVGSALKGTEVTLTATPYNSDFELSGWNVTGATPSSTTALTTTFTMPVDGVGVTATFSQPTALIDEVVINEVTFATRNVDTPGEFAATIADAGKLYQFGRPIAWSAVDPRAAYDAGGELPGRSWDKSYETASWSEANDPCPTGYRVPNGAEMAALSDAGKVRSQWVAKTATTPAGRAYTDLITGKTVFMRVSSQRYYNDGDLQYPDRNGRYWTNEQINGTTGARLFIFDDPSGGAGVVSNTTTPYAISVRCVKK